MRSAHFGAGDGRIVLDEVRCVGNESELLNCRAAEKGVHNCAPTEDAGIYCPCECAYNIYIAVECLSCTIIEEKL